MSVERPEGSSATFFGLPLPVAGAAEAAVAILPVPYDATSSWIKGADGGPAAILEASQHVELWDSKTGTEPWRHGIETLPPLEWQGSPEELAAEVAGAVGSVLDRGQLSVVLGGEHSVTIGAARATADRFSDLSVLQIDAHADTRESYQGPRTTMPA